MHALHVHLSCIKFVLSHINPSKKQNIKIMIPEYITYKNNDVRCMWSYQRQFTLGGHALTVVCTILLIVFGFFITVYFNNSGKVQYKHIYTKKIIFFAVTHDICSGAIVYLVQVYIIKITCHSVCLHPIREKPIVYVKA
jgi:hypothetical protein